MKTYKFQEPSKLLSFRVPESKEKKYRSLIQLYIDLYWESKETDPIEQFKELYDLMINHMKVKGKPPEKMINKIKKIEEVLETYEIIRNV